MASDIYRPAWKSSPLIDIIWGPDLDKDITHPTPTVEEYNLLNRKLNNFMRATASNRRYYKEQERLYGKRT